MASPSSTPSESSSPDSASSTPSAPSSSVPDEWTLPDDVGYMVIEGVIGAGKTTLAKRLTESFEAKIFLEQFEENPFLERFYADRERWAFQTQLSFLASRFRQQKELRERDLFHRVVVSDYTFDKDRIFAHQTLDGDELQLYESLFRLMEPNVPTPDLIVYLQSTPERLMQNIAKRGRPYEQDMDPDYIASIHEAYDRYFFHYDKSPLLIVNAAEIDFVENEPDYHSLVRHIVNAHGSGMEYVTPSPSDA